MHSLILLVALQVATPGEMNCLGSVVNAQIPMDLYIAGVQQEGMSVLATEGRLVYLNGPRVASLQVGDIYRIVRPEGKIYDKLTGANRGIYYRDIGTIRVEVVSRE